MNANNKYRLSLVIGLAVGILGLTLKFGNVLPSKSIPLRIIFGLSLLIIIVTLIIRRTSNSDKQNTDVRFFGKNSTMRPFIVVCVLIVLIPVIGYLSNYFNRDKIASFEKHKKNSRRYNS
jgi:cytochrome b561